MNLHPGDRDMIRMFHLQEEDMIRMFHLQEEDMIRMLHLQEGDMIQMLHLQEGDMIPMLHLQEEGKIPILMFPHLVGRTGKKIPTHLRHVGGRKTLTPTCHRPEEALSLILTPRHR